VALLTIQFFMVTNYFDKDIGH